MPGKVRFLSFQRSAATVHLLRSIQRYRPNAVRIYQGPHSGPITKREVKPDMYQDETLVCKECGAEFIFTAGEQEFYAERGFQNKPQRCKACRDARKNAARGPREYFTAVCAACGGEARVPFEPKSDRPVYCSDCYARMKEEA